MISIIREESEKEVLKRGQEVEQVIKMPGWNDYIKPLILELRNQATASIMGNLETDDKNVRSDLLNKGAVKVANGILFHIEGWIKKKNTVLEIQAKRENK